MLIHSLTLENVKSYTRTKVEFSPGTNAIVGHNGSGKTTILEAIGYALFDHLPYSQADFVREGQRSASVTVEFLSDYDERAYQVMRSCGSGRAHTVIDPELDIRICEGKADVMQFLRLHLGIGADAEPGDLFRNAVGVPQGSFTVSFLATASARKAVFDPLLKVAEYRRAWERMREPLSLLRERVGDQAVEISRLEGELIRLPAVQAEADALTGRIRSADTELRAAQTELTAAESARQTMETKRERLLELQSMVQMEQQVVAEQERTLAAARQRLTESKEAVTTTEANRAGHDAYRAAQQDQRAVNERMVQRRRLQDERANVHTRLTQAAAQEDARKRALADIAEAEKTAADLADAAAEQERLDLEVRDTQRQVDRLKESAARVQRERAAVDRAQTRLERMRAEVARAQKLEASREQLQTRVEFLQQEITAEKTKSTQLYTEMKTIEEQGGQLKSLETAAVCPICEQPLSEEDRQQLLIRLRQRWKEMDGKAKASTETIRQAEEEREQARARLAQQEQTLRSLSRQHAVDTAETELTELKTQLTEAHAAAEGLKEAPQRVEHLQQGLRALGDPRRRRDAAMQQAQGRERVEEAMQEQRAQAEQQRIALAALDESMAEFANLDEEATRIASQLEKFRTADDLYRRSQDAAEALSQREQESAAAEMALQDGRERYESGQAQLAASRLEFDEEDLQEVKAQVVEIRSRCVQLETDLGQWRERLSRAEQEIAHLQALKQRLAAAQAMHDRLAEQEELLQFLRSVIQEAGPFVTKALVQQISYTANQLFGQIMEDYTRTLQWQEDYGIILEVDGREREFAQLSGGEQMSAALAVRLALLQEMSDIAVAFFDEPTTNLDDVRRDALARQIVGVRGFEQLFIISHDDSFEQATEKLIRVEKRNGASEINYG
ncbi:MAG: AAA family ATPase [Caldilineaceae bacterium]|nr:AAA family ATPase [Caldilineaceae bacterium]